MLRDLSSGRATALGIAAILLWSTSVAVARSLAASLGAATAGAAVYATATVVLFALLTKDRSWHALRHLPGRYVIGCGALFVVYTMALMHALALASGARQTLEIGLLNYLWPALTILFSLPILGNRARVWLIPGTALALAGVALVLNPGASVSLRSLMGGFRENPGAYSLGLLAAVSWALYSNLARRWGDPDSHGGTLLFAAATGIAFALQHVLNPEASRFSPRVVFEVAFLGAATAVAYVFWDVAMRRGNVVVVAACSYFTPLLSTVVICVYLHVLPSPTLALGCALLIAGSFLSWRSVRVRGEG
jgi:drug/metabolite transporter (DMT)-like permease